MNPDDIPDGGSEYDWGPGMFPPGVADGEGQHKMQDNFGANMIPPQHEGAINDNFARAVADRRTDPTNPESNRDFECYGNPDRYGAQPPLVQADPQANISHNPDRFGPRIPRLRRAR